MFNDNEIYTSLMSSGDPRTFDSNGTIARQYDMVVYPKGDPGDIYEPDLKANGDINFINTRTQKKLLTEPINIKGPVTNVSVGKIEDGDSFNISTVSGTDPETGEPTLVLNFTYPCSDTTLNGTTSRHNSFYAPICAGDQNQILIANQKGIPEWQNKDYYIKDDAQAILTQSNTIKIDSDNNNKISVQLNTEENELMLKNEYLTTARHIPNITVVEGDLPAPGEGETWASLGYYAGDLCIQLEPVTTSE